METVNAGGVIIRFAQGVPNPKLEFKSVREMTDYLFSQYYECRERRNKVVLCGVNGCVFKAVSQGLQRRGFERGLELDISYSREQIRTPDERYVVNMPWFVEKVLDLPKED